VALDQAQGQLAKDIASQNDAKVDLSRYQQLWQAGVIPRQQLDSQQATVGQFDGAIQSDKAQIDNQKLQLTYCRITAPISGRVGLRLVDAGNIVHAADANGMLVITQVQPMAVLFTLPEDNVPEVVSEMKKRQLSVEAYARDNKQMLATGKLVTLDNQIDQTTGTLKFKSEFDNHDMSLWPNQFVNVRLYLSVKKDAIVVSSAAIQKGVQDSFVYVIDSSNAAQVRPVQVDFTEGNQSVIAKGLTEGEQVVVDGADKLQSGAAVTAHQAASGRALTGNSAPGSTP
jgi:membrane fusion protein, multidrug efflux system